MHSCGGGLAQSLFWGSKGRTEAEIAASESITCAGGFCARPCVFVAGNVLSRVHELLLFFFSLP